MNAVSLATSCHVNYCMRRKFCVYFVVKKRHCATKQYSWCSNSLMSCIPLEKNYSCIQYTPFKDSLIILGLHLLKRNKILLSLSVWILLPFVNLLILPSSASFLIKYRCCFWPGLPVCITFISIQSINRYWFIMAWQNASYTPTPFITVVFLKCEPDVFHHHTVYQSAYLVAPPASITHR